MHGTWLITSGPFVEQTIPAIMFIIFCVTDLLSAGVLEESENFPFVTELLCFVHTLHQNVHYRSLYVFFNPLRFQILAPFISFVRFCYFYLSRILRTFKEGLSSIAGTGTC